LVKIRSQKEHHLYDVSYENLGNPGHIFEYEWAATYCQDKIIMDFGCNTGLGSIILLNGGAKRVIGVDVSKKAIEAAKENFKDQNQTLFELVEEDSLPFEENTFDVIVALNIIEHLEFPKRNLEAILKILKPGGKLLVTTVNRHFRIWPWQKPWNEFHYREYSKASFKRELKRHFPQVELLGSVDVESPYYPYSFSFVFKRKFRLGIYYPTLNFLRNFLRPIMVAVRLKKPIDPQSIKNQKAKSAQIVKKHVDYEKYKERILISNKQVNRLPKFLAIAYKNTNNKV